MKTKWHWGECPRIVARLRPFLYLFLLAWVNVYICRESFFTEFTGHFNSMHGEWMALARLANFHSWSPSWWPWWGDGSPLEYTYAPLIPAMTAALAWLEHGSYALALHQITGLTYCLTPLVLYVIGWKASGAAGYSFAAALACSLLTPIMLIAPDAAFRLVALRDARRLTMLFDWDDLPHVMSINLLPLAVWFLWRSLERRRRLDFFIAGFAMAMMMLATMFGLVLVALIIITVPLSIPAPGRLRNLARAAATALCAYIVACPWLPPSLILQAHTNAGLDGEAAQTSGALIALGIVALACAIVYFVGARRARSQALRWLLLFGCIVLLIPVLDQYANFHFLPQPGRYKFEADLAVTWIVVFCARPLIERIPTRARLLLVLPLLFFAERQVVGYRRYARLALGQVDTARSIEYRTAKWIEEHLPGQRVMMPGSIGQWADVFARVPQTGAQPYTTGPNWSEYLASYIVRSDDGAGERAAEISILWLKAFGSQAVVVPGPQSLEYWKPFAHPRKFDGVLPIVWRDGDTTIYRVSARPFSLAHVLRPNDLVRHPPVNGTDVGEMRQFVAALEDPAAPPATLNWDGDNKAVIHARLQPGEVVSAQITWYPGWHARVNGAERQIKPDGIGLMAVDTGCSGECEIALEYDGSVELRACRIASAGFTGLLLIVLIFGGACQTRLKPRVPH